MHEYQLQLFIFYSSPIHVSEGVRSICVRGSGGIKSVALSEGHRLLVEFVEILVVYARILELLNFGSLNVLYLFSLHIDFLSDFSAFFQVVQSILFLVIFVGRNLPSNLVGVLDESLLSVLFDLSLLELYLLLLLDLMHVVLSLDSGLLGEGGGLLLELLLPGLLEVGLDALSLRLLQLFSFSSLSLSFLEGSLCSEGINLSLPVGSLLLKLPKSLDFPLLFLSQSLRLLLLLEFSLVLSSLMLNNLLIQVFFFLSSFLLLKKSLGIGLGSLSHEEIDLCSLGLVGSFIL